MEKSKCLNLLPYQEELLKRLFNREEKYFVICPKNHGRRYVRENIDSLIIPLLNAVHSAKIEGVDIPQDAVEDGLQLLEGKITADELVAKYTERYKRH